MEKRHFCCTQHNPGDLQGLADLLLMCVPPRPVVFDALCGSISVRLSLFLLLLLSPFETTPTGRPAPRARVFSATSTFLV